MNLEPKNIRKTGFIGLAILLVLNGIGYFGLHQPAAYFFSENWWSTWAPAYLAWLVITVICLGVSVKSQSR